MNTGLIFAAIFIGLLAGVVFWPMELKKQIKYFGLALLLTFVMTAVRLSMTVSGVGFVDALINPPAWKLLALIFASLGILISIVLKLAFKKSRKGHNPHKRP